jgi:pimeloyl-ACP methyl ester carboxylesterase
MVASASRFDQIHVADTPFERVRAADGVELAVEAIGPPNAASLMFAHGFGQTRHAWSKTAATLAKNNWRCVTADARGHGDSGWRDDGAYEFEQFVDDLVRVAHFAQNPSAQKPILIGASMGGLLGLIAQAQFQTFRALILVDITPRWETAGIERILSFMRAYPQGFESIEQAAEAIAHYLPHRREKKSPERLRQLLVPTSDARLRWHWDARLLDSIAAKGASQQEMLVNAAKCMRVPMLLISGKQSDIVSDSTIAEFLACVSHARHVRVEKATHMVVGDENDAFTQAVLEFVDGLH